MNCKHENIIHVELVQITNKPADITLTRSYYQCKDCTEVLPIKTFEKIIRNVEHITTIT